MTDPGFSTDTSGKDPALPDGEIQLVVFDLSGCELALEIHKVREIIRVSEITLMPKAPKFLEGIISLRGRIIPVLDLKKRFDMPLIDRTEESRILVVETRDQMLGLLVDKMNGVLKVPQSLIQPAAEPMLNFGVEYIEGLAAWEGRLILLFHLEKILAFGAAKALPEWEGASHGEEKIFGH